MASTVPCFKPGNKKIQNRLALSQNIFWKAPPQKKPKKTTIGGPPLQCQATTNAELACIILIYTFPFSIHIYKYKCKACCYIHIKMFLKIGRKEREREGEREREREREIGRKIDREKER